MANQRMSENWAKMKTDIQSIWGAELTDEELKEGRRDLKKMVEVIHRNTGEPRFKIRERIIVLL